MLEDVQERDVQERLARSKAIASDVTLSEPARFRRLIEEGSHPEVAAGMLGLRDRTVWEEWCREDSALFRLAEASIEFWTNLMEAHRARNRDPEWARAVFERDGYRCRRCGAGGEIHAHHIKPWADNPEARLDIDNGETLCIECHAQEHPRQAALIRSTDQGKRKRRA